MAYEVGDKVRILPEPPSEEIMRDIWVSWVKTMDKFCGQEAIIQEAEYCDGDGNYYRLDVDHGRFVWCDECFTAEEPAPDPELDTTEFFALLNM